MPPELAWRKHFALLVYLARSPGGTRRRDHLVGLLWPDKDEAKARHSLNEACRAIRRGAGDAALTTHADAVTLAGVALATDWAAAETALAAGDDTALAGLWRGDFLEGFGIADASPFEDWLAGERLAWRTRFRDALTAAAERAAQQGDTVRGLALAASVLAHDPSAEAALRTAMSCEALSGAAPAALERFAAYRAWLAREHGAEPAADLTRLAERIRAGLRTARPGAPEPVHEPPLLERHGALTALAGRLPRAGGAAAVVMVTGEAGHGRSRLVREIADRARLSGILVVATACVAADADTPGGVLAELLRRGLADAPGLGAAPGAALGTLAALEPEVARRYPGAVTPARVTPGDVGRALGAAVHAVAEETPLLIVIDDAQLADDVTLDALPVLLREAMTAPVTVMLAVRMDADTPAPLVALRARIGHDVPGVEVALEPLSDEGVDALVAALLPAYDAGQRERLVRRLRHEAGGVPLYIVEIVRALAAGGETAGIWPLEGETTAQPLPFRVPGAVAAALTLRAAALGSDARATLLAAAVYGERVDEPLLAAITDQAQEHVERQLGELERAGFLVFDGARYRLGAELVRAFLTSLMLTGGERKRLHERIVRALGMAGRADTLLFAEHLYGAGAWPEAAALAGKLADVARASGGARRAERAARLHAKAAARLGLL